MIIDLTHPITPRIPVYFPWHPATEIRQTANYAWNRCVVNALTIGTHTGTHIDAPKHVIEGGHAIDQYDTRLWMLDAYVCDFTPRAPGVAITAIDLEKKSIPGATAVIIKTGWDARFGDADYYTTYPPLSNDAAEFLAGLGAPLIAADTPYTLDVHHILLRRGIPLVTNLNNTSRLQEGMVQLVSAPLLIESGDGAPARVFAVTEDRRR
ncbi:MAG: cyclase family protein [Acidobacteriota bacterium]